MRIFAILTATVAGFLCGVWAVRRKVKADPALKAAEEYAAQLDREIDKAAWDAWEAVVFSKNPWWPNVPRYFEKDYTSKWKIPKNVV